MDDRETIKEELTGICLFDVFEDSTLTEVQSRLAEIMGHLQSYTKGFRNFRFNVEDNGEIEVFIVADRDETDVEYNTRLEKKT